MTQRLVRFPRYLWAAPWSCVGLIIGSIGIATGGSGWRRGGTLEFHGGFVAWLLNHAPLSGGAMAMAWGHVILGQTPTALDLTREHELVHVHQYERWGPLFIPAYVLCSAVIWFRGGDPYRDNPFEREAFSIS